MKTMIASAVALAAALRLAVPAAAQVDGKVIYGSDDRRDLYETESPKLRSLADSTVALIWRTALTAEGSISKLETRPYGSDHDLCRDEPFYEQITAAFCSGSLVAPDVIMTAGHCIPTDERCGNTKFVFGFAVKKKGEMPLTVQTEDVYSCKQLLGSDQANDGADWALIQLDRRVAGHAPLKLNLTGAIENKTPLVVIGHPAGLPTKIAGGATVRDSSKKSYFTTNLDTFGGNSGSAVFNAKTGLVEGILVRGDEDYVDRGSCKVSNVCPVDGCTGEEATRISAVSDKLPGARHRARMAELRPTLASLLQSIERTAQ